MIYYMCLWIEIVGVLDRLTGTIRWREVKTSSEALRQTQFAPRLGIT
jgi:hypothetical protein